jgi:hypothetical protein
MHAGRTPGSYTPATAVVHQLYLELVRIKALRPSASGAADERAAFLRLAAYLMKQMLIHHARPMSRRLTEGFRDSRDMKVSVSPDLRWVLYSQLDRSGSNVMMAENIR